MALTLADLLSSDSKLFAKSEFGPANSDWPVLSFSSPKIARDFQSECRRGKDFVIYVGTSNPLDTPELAHRQRLMSVVDVEPRAIVQTKSIVSADAWATAQSRYPGRWDVSLRLARAWQVEGFPRAHDSLPSTYLKFRNPGTRGHPIPVEATDFSKLKSLELIPVDLELTVRAENVLNLNIDDEALRKEISRLANLIHADIPRALKDRNGTYPLRIGPNYSEVFQNLNKAWREQGGVCALCDERIPVPASNKLLKMSRDRIDSSDKEYSAGNLQITHYGCNLAKSDSSLDEWLEFRNMLGGVL